MRLLESKITIQVAADEFLKFLLHCVCVCVDVHMCVCNTGKRQLSSQLLDLRGSH